MEVGRGREEEEKEGGGGGEEEGDWWGSRKRGQRQRSGRHILWICGIL